MHHVTKLTAELRRQCNREIHTGQGGAEVFAVDGGRIVKYASQEKCGANWPSHQREAAFCRYAQECALPFVPQVHCVCADEDAQVIVQQEHAPLSRTQLSEALLDAVMDVLAQIHTTPVPDFLAGGGAEPVSFTDAEAEQCLAGWESVLAEHDGAFSAEVLRKIPAHISALNLCFFSRLRCLTHGDFHFDNLLMTPDGRVLVCDWQGCGAGDPSGDLSFFISRLLSDGYALDEGWLTARYCFHASQKGLSITPSHVRAQMALANLNTSFRYWHLYLHGAEEGRVRDIFGKMVADFLQLMQAR